MTLDQLPGALNEVLDFKTKPATFVGHEMTKLAPEGTRLILAGIVCVAAILIKLTSAAFPAEET